MGNDEARYIFYGRLSDLIVAYWAAEKVKVPDDAPGRLGRCAEMNMRCAEELEMLRKYYFGAKHFPVCERCEYYRSGVKHRFDVEEGENDG